MKRIFTIAALLFLLAGQLQGQEYRRGFSIYPLNQQIGFRTNFYKAWFWDFKGGVTVSRLPFFKLELSACKQMRKTDKYALYTGAGLTLDSYIPGVRVPFGMELHPLTDLPELGFVAEVAPKVTFGPTNFLNTILVGHVGMVWYLKQHTAKKEKP